MLNSFLRIAVSFGLASLVFFGCATEPVPDCFIGDAEAEPELQIIHRSPQLAPAPVTPGMRIPLTAAPQGGMILLVGARARNVDACGIELRAVLRDVEADQIVSVEERAVRLLPTEDGWGDPNPPGGLSSYANLATCPNAALERDAFAERYELTVTLTEFSGRTTEQVVHVEPDCPDDAFEQLCRCQCRADYVAGESCDGPDPD